MWACVIILITEIGCRFTDICCAATRVRIFTGVCAYNRRCGRYFAVLHRPPVRGQVGSLRRYQRCFVGSPQLQRPRQHRPRQHVLRGVCAFSPARLLVVRGGKWCSPIFACRAHRSAFGRSQIPELQIPRSTARRGICIRVCIRGEKCVVYRGALVLICCVEKTPFNIGTQKCVLRKDFVVHSKRVFHASVSKRLYHITCQRDAILHQTRNACSTFGHCAECGTPSIARASAKKPQLTI